jgi:hypothetical protein
VQTYWSWQSTAHNTGNIYTDTVTDVVWLVQRHAMGWTVLGLNPSGGKFFPTRPDQSQVPPSFLYNGYRVSFPGVKQLRCGINNSPPSSAKFKERVQIYLYSLSGPSRPVIGQTLPLPYNNSCPEHSPATHCIYWNVILFWGFHKQILVFGIWNIYLNNFTRQIKKNVTYK